MEFDRPSWMISKRGEGVVTSVEDIKSTSGGIKLLLQRESFESVFSSGSLGEIKSLIRPDQKSPPLPHAAEAIKALLRTPGLAKRLAVELPKIHWQDLKDGEVAQSTGILSDHFQELTISDRQIVLALARAMGWAGADSISKLVESLKSEENLILADQLIKLAEHCKHVQKLCVQFAGNPGQSALERFFTASTSTLTELALQNCNLVANKELQLLISSMKQSGSRLQALHLIENQIQEQEMRDLSKALPETNLRTLCIERNEIGDGGLQSLTETLAGNGSKLRSLSLVQISADFDPLWDTLQSGNNLEKLSVGSYQQTSTKMTLALGDTVHCKLEHLKLRVPGDLSSAVSIAKSIQSSSIKSLDWWVPDTSTADADKEIQELTDSLCNSNVVSLAWGSSSGETSAQVISKLVKEKSSLESVKWVSDQPCPLTAVHQEEIVEAASANRESKLVSLDLGTMQSKDAEISRDQLISENRFKQEVAREVQTLAPEQTLEPTEEEGEEALTAKLIICGDSGVGKTTILSCLRQSEKLPVFLEKLYHTSVELLPCFSLARYGIKIRHMKLGKYRLVMLDLGGSEKFQSFHHHFFKGSEKSLFLVVCKVDRERNRRELEETLHHWLRLIYSHRTATWSEFPKVIIALNYFYKADRRDTWARDAATRVADDYSKALQTEKNYVLLEVQALNSAKTVDQMKPLRRALRGELDKLSERQKVPRGCNEIITVFKTSRSSRMLDLKTFDDSYGQARVTQALRCMNDMGEAVYFDRASSGVLRGDCVVLDVKWFVRKVLYVFMKESYWKQAQSGVVDVPYVRYLLMKKSKVTEEDFAYMLQCLHEMGALIPWDENWAGNWTVPPMSVMIPSLRSSVDMRPRWRDISEVALQWGRRLECKDKFTLLPSGLSTIIQDTVKRLYKDSLNYEFGNGWGSFQEKGVSVVVELGGARQAVLEWVDILVTAPPEKDIKVQAEKQVSEVKEAIRSLVHKQCTYLKLRESVLHPRLVKKTLQLEETAEDDLKTGAVPLNKLTEKARVDGLMHKFSWPGRWEAVEMTELLLASELQEYIRGQYDQMAYILSEYEDNVQPAFGTEPVMAYERPQLENDQLQKVVDYLSRKIDEVKGITEEIRADVKDIKKAVEELQRHMLQFGDKILAKCGRMLKLQTTRPKWPYVTEDTTGGVLKKYCTLGKQVRLHYMCEHSDKPHSIQGAKGVSLNFPSDWTKRYAKVLIPSLTVMFFSARVGLAFAGSAGRTADMVLEMGHDKLMAYLNGCLVKPGAKEVINKLQGQPTEQEVETLFGMVEAKLGPDRDMKEYMSELFDLRPKKFGDNTQLWLCSKHFTL